MRRLYSNRGETIVESLCAILVVAVVCVFLCGAIVSAARANKQVRESNQSFSYKTMDQTRQIKIIVDDGAQKYTYDALEHSTSKSDEDTSDYEDVIYRYYTAAEEAGN